MKNPVIQVLESSNTPAVLSKKQELMLADWIVTAKGNDLSDIVTIKDNSACGVFLKSGKDIPCLAVAEDGLGNWCVLTFDCIAVQYLHSEIL